MKVYAVNIFARWEFDKYKLFFKESDAWEYATEHNKTIDVSCGNDLCCFARVEEMEIE